MRTRAWGQSPPAVSPAIWNKTADFGLVTGKPEHMQMVQSRHQWRSGDGETDWLSMLVKTLEKLSDPKERAVPCDADDLIAAKAHLAHPSYFNGFYGSHFSLRN